MLRNPIVCRVKHTPGQNDVVSETVEGIHKFGQKLLVFAYGEALDVLEDEGSSIELSDKANEFQDKAVARIFKRALTDHGKALAGRAAKNTVDWPVAYLGRQANIGGAQAYHRSGNHGSCRKVELMNCAMHGSISTAAATSKPACSNPRLKPPTPAKRSIPIGRSVLIFSKRGRR